MAYKVDKKGKKITFIFPKECNPNTEEVTAPSKYFGTPINDGVELGEVTIKFKDINDDKDDVVLEKHFKAKKIKLTKGTERLLDRDLKHIRKNVNLK